MKILIACEYSGVVRDEFLKLGHDAISCDILPCESEYYTKEDRHYQGDIMDILNDGWDMMIAHPPCTYLRRYVLKIPYQVEYLKCLNIHKPYNPMNMDTHIVKQLDFG